MKKQTISILGAILVLILVTLACSSRTAIPVEEIPRGDIIVSMVYGSEKEEWLEPLVKEYNQLRHETESGLVIRVEATPMGSIESANQIIDGTMTPTVWSPASSIYIPVANAAWRQSHAEDLVVGTPNDLVLSPVVIAMWQPMAETLGWPETPIGWGDIADLAISDEGWSAFGYPEWGDFKLGHTHPDFSNSGIVSIITETYAGTGKQRGLTLDDLSNPELMKFMEDVESSIIHYGSSTGFFARRMFEKGPSYLSAAVMYENLVVAQESKRISGGVSQIPVVAIYPKEGTFWTNNPYVILNAPWVEDDAREAAEDFEAFLLAEEQQRRAIALGFRPADPAIPLSSPLDSQHGVDPTQPQTVLEIPKAEVIEGIVSLWRQTKKPVDVTVVMDISGSMEGEKISSARASLANFIDLFQDRDRLRVTIFSEEITEMSPLSALGDKRDDLKRRVSGIIEGGGTRLYDATLEAYNDLLENGDPDHIRAVVVLTDGADTESSIELNELLYEIGASGEEGGNAIKIFTIAFGADAEENILNQISETTGGRQYDATPTTIREIYSEIATFF
jgi:Ca-activated chloride channel family protein